MVDMTGNQDSLSDLNKLRGLLQQAVDLLDALVKTSPAAFPHSRQSLLERGVCLVCEKPIHGRKIRGCHESCYKSVMRLIERGEVTESEAIAGGVLAAKRAAGRPPAHVTADQIRNRLKDGEMSNAKTSEARRLAEEGIALTKKVLDEENKSRRRRKNRHKSG